MRRRDWLGQAPFTLNLGAGFFGFYAHVGLLCVLEEYELRPRRVVGVSAGALAGGLWSSGLCAQDIAQQLAALRRSEFWDPGIPLGGLLRGRKFDNKLREVLAPTGVRQVQECPTPFVAVAHDVLGRRTKPVGDGSMVLAIRASCTVPLMFRPVFRQGRMLVDGGVSDRCGLCALESEERVFLHYLPSRRRVRLGRATQPPESNERSRLVLTIPQLPRVTPFRLDQGPLAFRRAREFAQGWLNEEMA